MKDILNPAVQRINFQYTPNPPSTSCLNNTTLKLENVCKLPLNQATLSSNRHIIKIELQSILNKTLRI